MKMTDAERQAFLKSRQSGVGGSDAPNLIGVGFRSAAAVYVDKTTPVDLRPPRGVLARGLALEDVVADLYATTLDIELKTPAERGLGPMVRHPDRAWQFCHPDRMRPDGVKVQLKTTANFGHDWGPSGSDEIPDGYRVQCTHEMGCCGDDVEDLAALDVVSWELRFYRLKFDRALYVWLTDVEAGFWDLVQRRTPPGPEWELQFRKPFEANWCAGRRVELPGDGADLVGRLQRVKKVAEDADAEARRLKRLVEIRMGDAEAATAGNWELRRVFVNGSTFTTTRRSHTRLDVRERKDAYA